MTSVDDVQSVEATVRGRRVSALRTAGDLPALLLVHGASGHAETWRSLMLALRPFASWAISLPGRPGSPEPAAPTPASSAAWLAEAMDAFGIERPLVVGHSLGGAVAIEMALARPGGFRGLVLIASAARLKVAPAILEAAARATAPLPIDHAYGPQVERKTVEAYAAATACVPPEAALADWQACDGFDQRERLVELELETLLIHGSEDAMTPPRFQAWLAERLPAAERIELEGIGHMVPWEAPSRVAEALRGFATGRGEPR